MNELKIKAAKAALSFIDDGMILGVGTGSTVNFFIDELVNIKHRIDACVASSVQTEQLLKERGIPVIDLNVAFDLPIYIDGADRINPSRQMIKGGGGALTREKIIASVASQFICIVDEKKYIQQLGDFPIAVEVLPLARSFVARQLVAMGGDPEYREQFVTDNGNVILDVYNLDLRDPLAQENKIKLIPGVVESGIFAARIADKVIMACADGIKILP